MVSSVMKSKVSFLVTVLLVCSSYANDDIPKVSEVHRKLFVNFGAIGAKVTAALPRSGKIAKASLDRVKLDPNTFEEGHRTQLPTTRIPNVHSTFSETKGIPATLTPNVDSTFSETIEEFLFKKTLEKTAERFFGADAKRGFQLGRKIGKKYYSIAHKCEKYAKENKDLQCDNSLQCESSQSATCVPYCVMEIVEGISNTCYDKNGVPEETPCNYYDGSIFLGTTQSTPVKYNFTQCMS